MKTSQTVENYAQEKYVDVTDATVLELHKSRIDLAHQIGCDGLDPDNIDTYVCPIENPSTLWGLTGGIGAVGGRVHRQADHTRRHDQLPLDPRGVRTLQDNNTWTLPHDRTEECVEYHGTRARIHGLCYF